MSFLGNAVGAVVGGLASKGNSGGSTQTASKEPWEPSRALLESYIKQNGELNSHYQQNPFNSLQQTGYQNLFSDLDNFRSNIAPQLQGMNNGLLGTNYQRAPAGSELGGSMRQIDPSQFLPGAFQQTMRQSAGQGQGAGQPAPQGGLLGGMQQASQQQPQTGLLGAQIPIAAGGNYGQIDWSALNPYKNDLAPKPVEKPAMTSEQQLEDWLRARDPEKYRWDEIQRTIGQTG